jgi:hypothetical protein
MPRRKQMWFRMYTETMRDVNHSALKDRACSEVISLQVPFG